MHQPTPFSKPTNWYSGWLTMSTADPNEPQTLVVTSTDTSNDPKDPDRIYYRSDHFNFARKGVPIIFYFDGIHKDYHQPSDTPDTLDYDKTARVVVGLKHVVEGLAQ